MGAYKNANLQKCGEILIDIKTKNRKKKIYIFHCTYCNTECDQLKKFSLHVEEEHLNNLEDVLMEAELKFEAEPEEIKIQTLTDIKKIDNKNFDSSKDILMETLIRTERKEIQKLTDIEKADNKILDSSKDSRLEAQPEKIRILTGIEKADKKILDSSKDIQMEILIKTEPEEFETVTDIEKGDNKNFESSKDILMEAELKFEAEPEEFQAQTLTDIEKTDNKIFENSKENKTYVNADPTDTVNTVGPISHNESLNCEIKNELIKNTEDGNASDKETNEDPEFISVTSEDKLLEIDSDSEDENKDDLDEMPLKKRKLSGAKKDRNVKPKANSNELDSDDSKDAECNNSTSTISYETMDAASIKENILSGTFKLTTKKGRSKIWDIFGNIVNDEGTEIANKVACTKCFSVFKYDSRSTSNLVRHKCYYTMRENNIEKVEVNKETKKEAMRLFSEWCIKNCRSFQFVQDTGFIQISEFLISIGAKYGPNVDVEKLLPHPTTISQNIEKIYEATFLNVKHEIKADCKNGFGLTSDIWTDNYLRRSYISLTIHYAKNGQLISRLIGLNSMNGEKCTHDAMRLKTQTLLGKYDRKLEDGVMVTDRGSNMVAAFNCFPHIYCINHLLNNIIENAIKKVEEVTEICNLCSKLVKYLKKSSDNCKLSQTLKSHPPTRWNTMYYLLESVEKNWMDINNILQQKNELQKVEKINISHIKGVVNVMRPFEQASKTLEGEKYATLHLVYAYINGLKDTCISKDDDIEVVRKFKEALFEHIQTTVFLNISMTHKIAHFLFPPANKLLQFSEDEKENIKSKCAEELKIHWKNEGEKIMESPTSSKTSIISSYFKNFVTPTSNLTSKDKIAEEIQTYQNMNVPYEENFDVISWWYLHRTQLPLLYKLSCKLLATPASSATSERVFSIARQLLSEKRTNLDSNSAIFSQIMFLHMNPDKLTI